jgi:hypothetical protein
MAEDDSYLVCLRVEDLKVAVPGSTKKRCSACGRQVWVSPASLDLSRTKRVPLLCMPCAEERAANDEEGVVIQPLTAEQIKEIRDAIERG